MKSYISFLVALMMSVLLSISTVVDAKSGSFGGSRSSSSSSRSSSSSSRSISISRPSSSFSSSSRSSSGSSFFGGSTSRKVAATTAVGAGFWGASSSSDSTRSSKPSTPQSITVTRDNVVSGLKGKGAKGDQAGILWKSFANKPSTPTPVSPSRIDRAALDTMFTPSYRSNRRSSYYGNYNPTPPTHYRDVVHVQHSNGYGIWDYLMFDSILDNIGDRNMYYHHQNDQAFRDWRSDADKACAEGDTDVCDKLKDLDREMAEYKAKGVKVNPAYVTPGIDPDIYEANKIDPSKLNEIKICTGSVGSDYNSYVAVMSKVTKLKVTPVFTNGSADNLAKLAAGTCDMALVQDDITTPNLVKIVTPNQLQAGMFVCRNDSKVATASDLDDETTVYVGSDQTGSQFTLDELKKLSPTIAHIKVVDTQPIMQAVKTVQDTKDVKSCIFAVTTPEAPSFMELDKTGKFHGVPIFSKNLNKGQPYKLVTVGARHYKNLVPEEYREYGWNPGGIDAIGISSSLVTSQTWIDQNSTLYGLLNLERANLQASIQR